MYKLGLVLTAVAAVVTLWSMIHYLRAAWPELRSNSKL
jgi:CDP-diacylglycerol--glycerol-3-phosphate 3-phosphatidyltransferase